MAKKISQDLEDEIIRRYQAGERNIEIIAALHIGDNTVTRVLQRNGIQIRGPMQRRMAQSLQDEICKRYANGESPPSLAEEFGVHVSTMRDIIKANGYDLNPRGQQYRRFTDEEIMAIRDMVAKGLSQTAIAQTLGSSQSTIGRVMVQHGIEPNQVWHVRGENHGSWKGGRHVNQSGYIEVLLDPSDPMASMRNSQGYAMEHRLVLARKLGRPLKSNETVHHINGDKQDNRLENLQVRKGRHGSGTVYCCAECGSRNIVQCEIE